MTHEKLVEVVKELVKQHNELERRANHTQAMLDALLAGMAQSVSAVEKADDEFNQQ